MFTIDQPSCIACWKCVDECPQGAIARAERAVLDTSLCIGCGHCGAVCSKGAVRSEQGSFEPWARPSIASSDVRALLVGRRSTRHYQARDVEPALIDEIVSIGAFTPSATNARDVHATVLHGERLRSLTAAVNGYYQGLCRLVRNPFVRPLLWLLGGRQYFKDRNKLQRFFAQVDGFDQGRDWIFFHAPAVVVLTTPKKHRMFGRVNAAMAAEQMLHYAFSLGLGSCVIGYAEVALRRNRAARALAALDPDHEPQMVFTLGHPTVSYQSTPARAPFPIRWLEPNRSDAGGRGR